MVLLGLLPGVLASADVALAPLVVPVAVLGNDTDTLTVELPPADVDLELPPVDEDAPVVAEPPPIADALDPLVDPLDELLLVPMVLTLEPAPCEVDVEVEPELEPEFEVEPDTMSASARFVAERAIKSAVALNARFIFFS
ncbi:hypothetical protein LT85_2759 [Collimonas arenae]|uniref:Uncharacterized protein n=1 Tax=Collimonas arenae TaxID=279058 RepID=A0A0A1FGB7_9BURK|nr:hypothetical protein [Collimonas arenae]AIY41917.1 hypothetical protein LT85_2759 [Collimonas arenae]